MTSKFVRFLLALACVLSVAALAQTGSAASSPAASSAAASSTPVPTATGTKVGTVNIEQAIFATNEGRRDFEALSKKLEPKQNELKGLNDEIEALKKQLNTQQDKLNDEARTTLVKQIETRQKSLDRAVQDAREDAQNQQSEIAQRILQKLGPMIFKYAAENGFGVIIDTSQQWPQGPVFWWGDAVDVTKPVVDAYNAQSGVPAPAGSTAPAKPVSAKPAVPAAKPAATPAKPTEPPK